MSMKQNEMKMKGEEMKWNENSMEWSRKVPMEMNIKWQDNGNIHEHDITQWLGELMTACLNGSKTQSASISYFFVELPAPKVKSQDFSFFRKTMRCITQ